MLSPQLENSTSLNASNFDDVISITRDIVFDTNSLRDHISNNTLDEFYHTVISDTIIRLTVVSAQLMHSEDALITPFDDPYPSTDTQELTLSLQFSIQAIVDIVAAAFGKKRLNVELDFRKAMKSIPVDDIREAELLRLQNKLH